MCRCCLAIPSVCECRYADARICILWLGSSVGNLNPQEALSFFQQVLAICGPRSQVRFGDQGSLW